MPRIDIELPGLLRQVIETSPGDRGVDLQIEAKTLQDALDVIRRDHPQLAMHLFNERGQFREHVLCFLNDENSRWFDDYSAELHDGDRLMFMQAVSGG